MKYCIALYNLHLTGDVPPTPEEQQRFIHTVWLNYEMPPAVLGNQPKYAILSFENLKPTFKVVSEKPEGYAAPGYLLPTASGDCFKIAPDKLGYDSSKIDWWEEDYPSFLEEYDHLRSFVDGYLEGKFKTKDRAWFDRALQCFTTRLVHDFGDIAAPLLQMDAPFPTIKGKKISEVVKEIDITYVKAKLCTDFQKRTANAIILTPAYLELIDILRQKIVLDKCKICQNLFKVNKNQIYCSPECRQVPDSRKKRKQSDKNHQELCELIDKWLGPKQESDWIDTLSLSWYLNEINSRFLSNVPSKAHSLGRYLNKREVENKLKTRKKIIIRRRQKRKNKEYQFIRM